MLEIVGLPLIEKAFLTLSSTGGSLRYCGNNLPELNFAVCMTSFVERSRSIVCNDTSYPISWTKKPRAYHHIFEQVDYFIDKKKDYYGAQRKIYYLLKDSLSRAQSSSGANGYVLVRAFLQLSKVFQKLEQWENAIDAAKLASDLDPFNNTANLAVAFLCSDYGDSFEGYRFSEEAVSLDARSLAARRNLVTLASREELFYVANQHLKLRTALENFNLRPLEASSYINLAEAYVNDGDYKEALKVLDEGNSKLDSDEKDALQRYVLENLSWLKVNIAA